MRVPEVGPGGGKGALGPTDKRPNMSLTDLFTQTAVKDPNGTRAAIKTQLRLAGDESDELAQDFVEVLSRQGTLDDYARTAAGRDVLKEMALTPVRQARVEAMRQQRELQAAQQRSPPLRDSN
jgi:hypothetical protein